MLSRSHRKTAMKLTRWSIIPIACVLLSGRTTLAQSLTEQVNTVRQLNNQQLITDTPATATASEPSDQDFTIPSLWWQHQQQGEAINRRLINDWQAYNNTVSSIPHVDVQVNSQIWPLLNYLEQYAFITQFGKSAKFYGYQLRIFTGNRLVGLHVCDFGREIDSQNVDNSDTATLTARRQCVVELDYFGQGAIRGGRRR